MKTEVIAVDPANPDPEAIRRAASVLRGGGLIAFPTETVYGLGANAFETEAVARIFTAKGRPASNPVIVHVADPDSVLNVAATWPETAKSLAARFWPGPLTLVVAKRSEVPDIVTAGGPTVAIRCPAHPLARALIRAAGVPIAAPSANRSTELSPTRAEHVLKGLDGRIDMILDGGPCSGGLESTVVDVTGPVVRLLRHGLISVPMLEAVVGRVELVSGREEGMARSPGLMAKHYSPRTELRLAEEHGFFDDLYESIHAGRKVGGVLFSDVMETVGFLINLSTNPAHAASFLYDTLFRLDQAGLDLILVEMPPDTPEWAAMRDRLMRAATRT